MSLWRLLKPRTVPLPRWSGSCREFVQRQHEEREYTEFLRQKIEVARASMRAGASRPDEEVAAEAKIRISEILREADETGV